MKFHIGYVTNGKRNKFIKKSVEAFESIAEDEIKFYFVGNLLGDKELEEKGMYQYFVEKDDKGWITRKKNIAADMIRPFAEPEDIVLILADDVFPTGSVLKNLKVYFENGAEVVAPKIIKDLDRPHLRSFDWCTIGGPSGHGLLCFDDVDAHAYIDGSTFIFSAKVIESVRWNEDLFINQMEDVEMSHRLANSLQLRGAKDVVFYGPCQNWPKAQKTIRCLSPGECKCV